MKSTSIKVGNRTYSIASIDDQTFDTLLSCKRVYDNDVKSFIDYDEQLIVVRDRLHDDHKKELIIHELIHACIDNSGIEQSFDAEKFVSALSPRFAEILDNLSGVINEVVN